MIKLISNFSWLLIFVISIVSCTIPREEKRLVESDIKGKIIKLNNEGRDVYTISIKDNRHDELLQFSLFIGGYVEDGVISLNDSISKQANSGKVTFYKIKNNSYYKSLELDY